MPADCEQSSSELRLEIKESPRKAVELEFEFYQKESDKIIVKDLFGSGDSDEMEKKLQESIRKAKERRRSQHDQSSSSNQRNTDPDAHIGK